MTEFLQHCLNALVLGGTYALLGIGLTLVFGIMRVVNFAHGELYAYGAYMMYALVMKLGANFFVALALATALGVVLGAALELVLLRHLRSSNIDITMLVMIGAWMVLQNTEQLAWTGVAQSIANPFPADPIVLGAVSVSWNRVFVFVVAVALIAGTYALVNHTRLGMAMRATFQDREAAALMGVSIERIHTATFALGSGLAAAAGALLGPIFVVTPTMGDLAAAKAFAIVILGGMGSVAGSIIAGLMIGVSESMFVALFPDPSRSLTYAQAFSLLILMLVLLIRPTGLFGRAHVAME
jgi:branched-chain amino acid transport system permease protein